MNWGFLKDDKEGEIVILVNVSFNLLKKNLPKEIVILEHIRFAQYKPCAERSECIREESGKNIDLSSWEILSVFISFQSSLHYAQTGRHDRRSLHSDSWLMTK